MDLQSAAALAQIFGVVAVLTGVAFGIEQLRLLRVQRRDAAAVELMRSMQDAEFTHAFQLIYSLPSDGTAADLRARGFAYEEAAQVIGSRFETLGVLVFRGIIAFDLIEDLAGGVTVALWARLRPYVEDMRGVHGQPMYLEWFQWLAERFEACGRLQTVPAHLRHRNWTPPRRADGGRVPASTVGSAGMGPASDAARLRPNESLQLTEARTAPRHP